MRFVLFLLIFVFIHTSLKSQRLSSDEFQRIAAFEINNIDDFFDKFNFRRNTAFQKYIARNYPDANFERKDLLVKLFNSSNSEFDFSNLTDFVNLVVDSVPPRFLRFNDRQWYAELFCKVFYKGKRTNLILVLKFEKDPKGGYSWDLVSAKGDFLKFRPIRNDSLLVASEPLTSFNRSSNFFLSPASHGIDFSNIDNIFLNRNHIESYVYSGPRPFELNKLIFLIKKNEVKFDRLDSINYHLLQVPGWCLVLEYIRRRDVNSGWLINDLIPLLPDEKIEYMVNVLNIPKN